MRAYNANNLHDALRYFEFASQLNKTDTSLYLTQAVIAQKLFEKEKAIAAYEQLLKMDHRSPQIYRNLGKLYEETDKTAEAYRVFREGKRSEEHTTELQSLMCISYAVFCLKKNT